MHSRSQNGTPIHQFPCNGALSSKSSFPRPLCKRPLTAPCPEMVPLRQDKHVLNSWTSEDAQKPLFLESRPRVHCCVSRLPSIFATPSGSCGSKDKRPRKSCSTIENFRMAHRQASNLKRTEWNRKCQEELSTHICRISMRSLIEVC